MDIIKTLEQDAVIVWDDFLKGVTWLEHEATVLQAWVQHADPAVAKSVQNIIKDGENAASTLAQYTGDALSGVISAGAADAETLVANFIQGALGGSPAGTALTKAGQSITGDTSTILTSLIKVGVTKVLAAMASSGT